LLSNIAGRYAAANTRWIRTGLGPARRPARLADCRARPAPKEFTFASYAATLLFVNTVAGLAERENHHPDLEVGYGRVQVGYSTHDVAGLSRNDFICAAKIEALARNLRLAGSVIAAYGRQYRVELSDGETLLCVPRGKKSELVCGDQVKVQRTSADQGVIATLEPRRTLLYRSDHFKQKLIAANVTQIIIVVATEPPFSDDLITRCIVAAESQDIQVLIVLNKCDLGERVPAASASPAAVRETGLSGSEALCAQRTANACCRTWPTIPAC
jgi:pterin-4a-carbinolamine dehydratase